MNVVLIQDSGIYPDEEGSEFGMFYLMREKSDEIIFGVKYFPWNYEHSMDALRRNQKYAKDNNLKIIEEFTISRTRKALV